MKKYAAVLAVLLTLGLALSACGGSQPTAPSTPAPATPTTPTTPATSAPTPATPAAPVGEPFAAKPEVTLILTQHDPDASLPGKYCHAWADMVYEASRGRIQVEVNNGGSLAGPTASLDSVKSGVVDLAWGLQSFYPGQFTFTDGLTLPYLPYKNSAQASEAMMDIWDNNTILQQDTGYANTKVILIRANCDAPITTAKKKLEATSDLRGMTIRASAAPLVAWLGEFGATGQGCPITELFQNLQNGAFDGALTDWHGIDSFQLYDNCAKYFADEQVQFNTYYFLMNLDTYNSLSAENKAAIDACSGKAALDLMKNAWDDMTDGTKAAIAGKGGEVYKLSDSEHQKLVDAANKVRDDYIAKNGASMQQLYDRIVELSK